MSGHLGLHHWELTSCNDKNLPHSQLVIIHINGEWQGQRNNLRTVNTNILTILGNISAIYAVLITRDQNSVSSCSVTLPKYLTVTSGSFECQFNYNMKFHRKHCALSNRGVFNHQFIKQIFTDSLLYARHYKENHYRPEFCVLQFCNDCLGRPRKCGKATEANTKVSFYQITSSGHTISSEDTVFVSTVPHPEQWEQLASGWSNVETALSWSRAGSKNNRWRSKAT